MSTNLSPRSFAQGVLAALALFLASPLHADEPEKTFRNLTVSIPRLKAAPVIDGTVDAAEWKDAAVAPRLILWKDTDGDDRLTDEEKRVYWAYTDEGIFFAFQFQRPDNALEPVATVTQRDGQFWKKDDAVEVHFANVPGRELPLHYSRDYLFCWNLLGTKYDRVEFPVSDVGWNPEWRLKCRFVPVYGWEGEAFWPFKILEHAPRPRPGTAWRYNVVENNFSPKPTLNWQAFSLTWSSPRDFANLVFREAGDVFARVLDSGSLKKSGQAGVKLEVVNPGAAARKVHVGMKLYRRKPGAALKTSYLRAFDQSRDRPEDLAGRGKAPLFLSDEKVAGALLKDNYDLVKEFHEEASLEPGARRQLDLLVAAESGVYVVMYEVLEGADPKAGTVVAAAALPFAVPEPLAVKVENALLVDRSIQVQAELEYVPGWKGKGSIEAQIRAKEGAGKPLFVKQWADERFQGDFRFDVDVKGWKVGDYLLAVVVRDPSGRELGKREIALQVPETPRWMREKAGMEPVIPPPFRPIRVAKEGAVQRLDFLMGDYELAATVLPSRIRVRSIHEEERKDLLQGPMVLKARIGGREVTLGGQVTVERAKPEAVDCVARFEQEGLGVALQGSFEYDGMERVSLKVAPARGGGVMLEGLWLEIPIRKEYAELAGGLSDKMGTAPWSPPKEGLRLPFREVVWLGDAERRFVWFAENFKGWKLDAKGAREAIEVLREADGSTLLKVHFVRTGAPWKLEKEREIVWGMMFAPTKTLYPRPVHHGQIGKDMKVLARLAKEADMTCAERWRVYTGKGGRLDELQGWPEVLTEESFRETAEVVAASRAAGVKVLPYTGWQINRKATVYPMFGSEMVTIPMVDAGCQSDACCWNTPVQDVFSSLLRDRVADSKIDGFRMDAGYADLYKCSSLKHRGYGSQCGWVDDDGNVQGSLPIFSARRAAERGYRIFHGGVHKDGLCIQARSPGKCPPLWSFFDAALCAEGMDCSIRTMKDLPMEFYRAVQMGDAHGVHMVYMPKSDVTGMNSRLGVALLHNDSPRGMYLGPDGEVSYSRSAMSCKAAWKLVGRWMKYPENPRTEFWGYWKNARFVQTGSEDLKASFYLLRGERMLLTVMNFDRRPVEGAVKLNLADLGFAQAHARDAVTGEDVPFERGTLRLEFLPEGYRTIQVTATKPAPGLPVKTGGELPGGISPPFPASGSLPQGWTGDASLTRVDEGCLVLEPGANLMKLFALEKEKRHVLEVEARVDCDDGVCLGPEILKDRFDVLFQGAGRRWERTISSQMLPGRYETLRLVIDAPVDSASLSISLAGKGKARIRRLALHPIQPYTPPFDEDGPPAHAPNRAP